MAERITDLDTVSDVLAAAEKVNEDGYATGLQPYEIRHLLELVKDERRSANLSFRQMPYLAGMGFSDSPSQNAASAVRVIMAVAERNERIESEHTALFRDVEATRRVLGLPVSS